MKKYIGLALVYAFVVGIFLGISWVGSRAVSVMAQREPVEREHTIVIDAGHGGEDGGAVSCTGVMEKQINLEIALKLNDLLHILGHRTRMIRADDRSVYTSGDTIARRKVSDLKGRVRIVEETEDAVLVSIHQNLFPDARYNGAQVFYSPAGESQALAESLQTSFRQTINPGSNREIKRAKDVYLMEHTTCTAILVECGFLSNPEEETLLRTREYQQRLCTVIAAAVANFLDCQT